MRSFIISLISCLASLISISCNAQSRFVHPAPPTLESNVVIPPSWAFGVLYGGYTDQAETIQRIREIQQHNYPIDAYWIDSWFWSFADSGRGPKKYIDFVADTAAYPDRKKMWSFMQKNDIKGGFWIWNVILKTGNEKAYDAFKKRGYFSRVFLDKDTWHNKSSSTDMYQKGKDNAGTWCGVIDFKNPAAVHFFDKKMKHFFDEGADFIKLDRTDDISVCKAMFQLCQKYGKETKGRAFILSHSGGTSNDAYKRYPGKWTDDTRSDWNTEHPTKKFDPWVPRVAFKENIAMFTDPSKATSKIPFLTNDTGGFNIGHPAKPDAGLYIRWLQFSMFCPVTEVFSQPENTTSNLAFRYSAQADSIFRYYSHLRLRLFPYLYTYAHLSRLTGQNMIRKIPGHLYEFELGKELLVAPVYKQGARSRHVFLPAGDWINYWTGKNEKGGKLIDVSAPLNQIPLFVRAGAIIPMRKYATSVEKGNDNTLLLHVYPGKHSSFHLIEDDGTSNDYQKGIYASTLISLNSSVHAEKITINPVKGYYNGMGKSRSWRICLHTPRNVKRIKVNGRSVYFRRKDGLIVSDIFHFKRSQKIDAVILY